MGASAASALAAGAALTYDLHPLLFDMFLWAA